MTHRNEQLTEDFNRCTCKTFGNWREADVACPLFRADTEYGTPVFRHPTYAGLYTLTKATPNRDLFADLTEREAS